jgi:hypothetical protein
MPRDPFKLAHEHFQVPVLQALVKVDPCLLFTGLLAEPHSVLLELAKVEFQRLLLL